MLVLTWNLFHGRAVPSAGRDLQDEFAAALASWAWDVALLQEVPPWWPPVLAHAAGASAHSVRTSRNAGLCVRRAIATRAPDLIKSNGGGANAILVRGFHVEAHRHVVLRHRPERRVAHGVRLADGTWVANLHAQVHSEARAQADLRKAALALRAWALPGAPLVLGGDTNTRVPHADGFTVCGGCDVDFVLTDGLACSGDAEVLDRGALSDHAPVRVGLTGKD